MNRLRTRARQSSPPITDYTQGLTLSAEFNPGDTIPNGPYKTSNCVYSFTIDGLTGDGFIYEEGGSGLGSAAYVIGNQIYFRQGDGSGQVPAVNASSVIVDKPVGPCVCVIQFRPMMNPMTVWINGVRFDGTATGNTSGWTGSGTGFYTDGVSINSGVPVGCPTNAIPYSAISTLKRYENQEVLI